MKLSAGILLFRLRNNVPEFFLVHPGGPFFARKDDGHWTVPKGEYPPSESPLDAAIREFEEETGYHPSGDFIELAPIVQKGGKKVLCWAVAGELNAAAIRSNTFELEWPPRSGKKRSYPEVDKGDWFTLADAKKKIKATQIPLLEELTAILSQG